jgi:hypothetical protein
MCFSFFHEPISRLGAVYVYAVTIAIFYTSFRRKPESSNGASSDLREKVAPYWVPAIKGTTEYRGRVKKPASFRRKPTAVRDILHASTEQAWI